MPAAIVPNKQTPVMLPADSFGSFRFTLLGSALLIALLLVAYLNSFKVPYIFDDQESIQQNPSIRHLDTAFSPPSGHGITVSGRPVLNASFALNYALGGKKPFGFHVGNLLIHTLGALTLWAIARRTLKLPCFDGRYSQSATLLAWFIATLWALHPLQTESVTYLVQRAESLVGLFYLLTLYGFIRYAASRSWIWFIFTGGFCLLGMGAKEVMATAPVVIFLYDRAFVSGSLRSAWQRHGRLHLCLLSTLVWLAILVVSEHGRGGSVGVNETVTVWGYACTQAVAIVRYVWLSLWPAELTLDYGTLIEKNYAMIVPCALAVIGGLAATIIASIRRPTLGFLGVWFFAILAPSSSVIPVITQTVAEHRLYLSLAALTVGFVLLTHHWLRGRMWILLVLLIISASIVTVRRNLVYQDEITIWEDVVAKQPGHFRAWNNLGAYRLHRGKDYEAAVRDLTRSVQLSPDFPEANNGLGQALIKIGRREEGLALVEKSLRLAPDNLALHAGYGSALIDCKQLAEALTHLEKALTVIPLDSTLHYNIAFILMGLGRNAEAEPHLLFSLGENPDNLDVLINYGTVLRRLGRVDEAIDISNRALELKNDSPQAHNNLGIALMMQGKAEEGLNHLRESVRVNPKPYETRLNLSRALAQTGHVEEAIALCESLVQEKPDADLYNNLGALYGQQGQLEKAGEVFLSALQLDPNNTSARENYAKLRAYLDSRPAQR